MNKENKSISELEGWSWNSEIPEKENSSFEEYNFYLLHKKPIKSYSNADVYFMVGQESGLKYLVPIAINILRDNLFVKAEDFSSDLLSRILLISKEFWKSFPEFYQNMLEVIELNNGKISSFDADWEIKKQLKQALKHFFNCNPLNPQ